MGICMPIGGMPICPGIMGRGGIMPGIIPGIAPGIWPGIWPG
jgi:hypothetical protein